MAENKNDHVVIALFDSEDFANYGIDLLKKWDNATDEIKLGSIGTITKKGDKVKTHVSHQTGRGATIGAVLGIIAAVLTGGASWIVAGLGVGVLGGITGSFFKKSLHLTKEEIEKMGKELDEGKVAVVVTCDAFEVEETSKHLEMYGGVLNTYAVPSEALTEVSDAISTSTAQAPTEQSVEAVLDATEADLHSITDTDDMLGPTTQSPI